MNKFVISSGHAEKVSGANGYIKEHQEADKVVNRVYDILTKNGAVGYKFDDTTSRTQDENLATIVKFHNSRDRVLDVSVHFNSAQPQANGTECLYYDAKNLAVKMSAAMSDAMGIRNRGAIERKELYFLRNTNKKAILLEVCFVTNTDDVNAYRKNFEALCESIAKVIAEELAIKIVAVADKKPVDKKPVDKKPVSTSKTIGTIKVLVDDLNYYNSPRWSKPTGTVKKNTVLTIVDKVKVNGAYQYKTIVGNYITASSKYVKFTAK